jgi:hypothetical protein
MCKLQWCLERFGEDKQKVAELTSGKFPCDAIRLFIFICFAARLAPIFLL